MQTPDTLRHLLTAQGREPLSLGTKRRSCGGKESASCCCCCCCCSSCPGRPRLHTRRHSLPCPPRLQLQLCAWPPLKLLLLPVRRRRRCCCYRRCPAPPDVVVVTAVAVAAAIGTNCCAVGIAAFNVPAERSRVSRTADGMSAGVMTALMRLYLLLLLFHSPKTSLTSGGWRT